MRQVMVRYTVKPERVAENEELVRAVYEELAATRPRGLRYETFRLEDGVTFVHVAAAEGDDNALAESPAFARFQAGVRDRCDVQPVVTELHEVGAYRP
jgi:hypothetical protein